MRTCFKMSLFEMDSTLFTVVVTSFVNSGFAGVGYLFNFFKEEKQKREEELKYQREERKREREYVRDLYQKSLVNLSLLLNLLDQKLDENKDKRIQTIEDIHSWSTLLVLRHSDKALQKCVDDFVLYPDEDEAKRLREKILEVARREKELFPIDSPVDTSIDIPVAPVKPPGQIEITVQIDKNFRKEQLVKFGREIPGTYKFNYLLSEMSASQREKLVNNYFHSSECIPDQISLFIPNPQAETNPGYSRVQSWYAALDPTFTDPDQILMDWETAYSQTTDTASH